MIDFAGIVSKITGRTTAEPGAGVQAGTGDAGVATGGAFAALVELAAQVDAQETPGTLRLVVDNGTRPTLPAVPRAASAAELTTLPTVPPVGTPGAESEATPVVTLTTVDMLAKKAVKPVAQPAPDVVQEAAQVVAPAEAQTGEAKPAAKEETFSSDDAETQAPFLADARDVPVVALAAVPTPPPATPTPVEAKAMSTEQSSKAVGASRRGAEFVPARPAGAGAAATKSGQVVTGQAPTGQAATVQTVPAQASTPAQPEAEEAARQVLAALQQGALPTGGSAKAGSAKAQAQPAVTQGEEQAQILLSPELAATATRTARSRPAKANDAEVKVDLSAAAVAQTGKAAPRAEESLPTVEAAGKGRNETISAVPTGDAPRADASMRAIFDGLPPMIQSELSARPVGGVTGPATGEALADKVIDMGVSGQWIDQMAQEIASLADGSGHSRFSLSPPNLGKLQVELWQGEGVTNVRFTAETDEAARRLAEGRHTLSSDARLSALNLGTISVEKASNPSDAGREQRQEDRQTGRQNPDLSGQAQQQNGQSQAQARSGNNGNGGSNQGSEWVRRVAPNQTNEASDASARASAPRSANGRVRFA